MTTTLPTWAVVVLALASPFVAAVALLTGVLLERGRRSLERALRLRDDRLRAYATMARLTNWIAAREELKTRELAEAYSEIEILTDNAQIKEAAYSLLEAAVEAWHTARDTIDQGGSDPYGTLQYEDARDLLVKRRDAFIRAAKEVLGLRRRGS